MNNSFFKKTVIILSLLIGGSGFIFSNNISQSTFLFALKHGINPLVISKADNSLSVDNSTVQQFIETYGIKDIEPWLSGVNENDYDGDIYLNRIYRVYIDENRVGINFLISELDSKNETIYAEPEYLRKPLYTPNDPAFNQQCSLPAVKALSAWDFWDIPNIMPGSGQEILLASVDTGVDYNHPDLIESIWVNQGEIPTYITEDAELFDIIDINGDGKLSSLELISDVIMSDLNEDGSVDLRDIFIEGSSFLDYIDNDGNGYVDDLIGWDPAGKWASNDPDNDPFPRTEAPATDGGTWAHGTHVAGILAATTDNGGGMASTVFNGKIMSVKCSIDGQSTDDPSIYNGYDGITYAAKAGYYANTFTIINNSWGGGGFSNSEQTVINNAHNNYGAIVVAAAGNGNDSGGEEYSAHYPSSYENVISVCAIGCNGNWGGWATFHPTVDLASPGEGVYSAIMNGGYASWMGSSMASPNAASCIGLLQSYYPDMNNDQLIERILNTADRFIYDRNPEYEECNGYNGTDCLGKGMVDVYEAIGVDISPNIIIQSTLLTEDANVSDSDGVINPGEHFWIQVNLINEEGWQDATDINAVLSTDYDGVTINSNSAYCSSLADGEICAAQYDFTLSDDIELGDIEFDVLTTAIGPDNFEFEANLLFEVNVSLNQAGFPVDVSSELISSAAIADLDNDGEDEIISSDKGGFIHVFEMDGTEWNTETFPFYTEDQNWGSPSIGNLDGDGFDDIVVSSKNGHIYIFGSSQTIESGLLLDFDSGSYVTATPALGDIDIDGLDEIVFAQYGGDKFLYAINFDGSNVGGFPIELDEKVQRGVALCDYNGDGDLEIAFGTDDEFIRLFSASGSSIWSYETGGDIRVAPTVLELSTGSKILLTGSKDDNFYALSEMGTPHFMIETDDDISSEASIVDVEGVGPVIFFASGNMIYAVESDGDAYGNWPMTVIGEVTSSIVFSEVNGQTYAIFGDEAGYVYMYSLSGNSYPNFPISYDFPFKGSPTIIDIDGDGDLEILIGSTQTLVSIDIKESGSADGYWNTHRSNMHRDGHFVSSEDALGVDDEIYDYQFALNKAFPNPFNPSTTIGFEIPHSMGVSLNVYDISGRLVKVLINEIRHRGIHSIVWDGTDNSGVSVSNGLYVYKLTSDQNISLSNKIIFMK